MDRDELINGIWDDDINKHSEKNYIYVSPCGYKCEIKRNNLWAYCGYVQLPEDHPYYDCSYHLLPHINVHGGLVYGYGGKFGFDCAHGDDIVPGTMTYRSKYPQIYKSILNGKKYWTFEEVLIETNSMALQFFNLKN